MNADYQTNGSDIGAQYIPKSAFGSGQLWFSGYSYQNLAISNTSRPALPNSSAANWKKMGSGIATSWNGGIKTDGSLWVWGANDLGQLGDGTTVAKQTSPVQTAHGGNDWYQLCLGRRHGVAIKTDGTLWSWGQGNFGAMGNNTSPTVTSTPVQTISGGANWKFVSAGYNHTMALKTDGTLWGWGLNATNGNNITRGQIGTDSIVGVYSSPVQTVSAGNNWKQMCAGMYHTAAVKTDGTLWLWGYNNAGQLGDNSTVDKSSPVQTVAGGTTWKQVTCNSSGSAAIKTDGTLWLWGSNSYGQLGDNTVVHKSSPVQTVAGGTNWKRVFAGSSAFCATKTDGTIWGMGYNGFGGLGLGDITSRSSPVQIWTGGVGWTSFNFTGYTSMAFVDDSF